MTAPAIVEDLEVVEQHGPRLGAGGPARVVYELDLERRKYNRGRRILCLLVLDSALPRLASRVSMRVRTP